MRSLRPKEVFNKITIFIVGSSFITLAIIARLFQLQVLAHDEYQEMANLSQYGYIDLPAQRGDIIIKDYHSGEEFPIATNTTLNLIYADPTIIKDPQYVASILSPLLFDLEYERAKEDEEIQERAKTLAAELSPEEIEELLKPSTDTEIREKFKDELTLSISQKQRPEILLTTELDNKTITAINSLNLSGIETFEGGYVYAYPPEIFDKEDAAEELAPYVEIPSGKLAKILEGQNRYVVLERRLDPDISDEIKRLMKEDPDDGLAGLGMREEYFRFYPEGNLAANIIGYVNHANVGQYGIESSFNNQLQGVAGKLHTKQDSIGRQITVGESTMEEAVDGDNIILTIDRSIQLQVEKILSAAVEEYRADSGQVIIINPETGAIIAMVHYPSFDPNNYGDVFTKEEIYLTEEEIEGLFPTKDEDVYYFYVNAITLDRYLVFEEKDEEGNKKFYRYVNLRGPEVYHNKIVSWPYEPGSVFKSIAMAIGIDDGDISPNTTYNDYGPIGVDFNVYTQEYDFEIKNSEGDYMGLVDMNTVLAKSLNTGMTFLAKEIGPALFYSYLEKFGFLDRTDIEFENENTGQIEYFEDWTESELATHAFGQGITVTMLQLANAYCALANGGVLMQPYIVDEVRHDNETITKTEPHQIRQIISQDTSSKLTQMLIYSTEYGVAANAQVEGHLVAGKTGTSQTYKHGKALSGTGTTLTSFAGYGPADNPKFVILVKFDHPRESEWGSMTAAPTFSKIASYLFDYYNIPPDK
jgi:cell division protein FtsI/penicillin-binding protein 2